jgi:hypothetical protein|tara:strand:- start:216 stop:968 length:753 start_codon:yes stop_codon:yes gene_type:complete
MTKVIVDTKNFLNFLTGFSKGVPDLRIDCAGSRITIEVAYAWYYLRKQYIPVSIEEEGALHIADLDKVIKFFKATKNAQVTMRQASPKKPLHLVAGGNKLQLPSTDDIESGIKAVVIRKLLKNCEQSGWSKLGELSLSTHSTIATKDLVSLSAMKTLIAKDSQFKLRIHCGENEMGIVAGKASSGRLFTSLTATDTDGPPTTVESYFGEWLPSCLQFLDEGNARMHLGIETPVIFEQDNTLLFILDESDD